MLEEKLSMLGEGPVFREGLLPLDISPTVSAIKSKLWWLAY